MALIDGIAGLEYKGLQWGRWSPSHILMHNNPETDTRKQPVGGVRQSVSFQLPSNFLRLLFRTLLAQGSWSKEQLTLWQRHKDVQHSVLMCCINTWMSLRRIIGAHVKRVSNSFICHSQQTAAGPFTSQRLNSGWFQTTFEFKARPSISLTSL